MHSVEDLTVIYFLNKSKLGQFYDSNMLIKRFKDPDHLGSGSEKVSGKKHHHLCSIFHKSFES